MLFSTSSRYLHLSVGVRAVYVRWQVHIYSKHSFPCTAPCWLTELLSPKTLGCCRTYITRTPIKYILEITNARIAFAHATGMRLLPEMASTYLMTICTRNVLAVLSKNENGVALCLQANNLGEASGPVSQKKVAATAMWEDWQLLMRKCRLRLVCICSTLTANWQIMCCIWSLRTGKSHSCSAF